MAIVAEHIDRSFGEIAALRQVNLTVGESEIFGLIGPDGAGKTTLFRIIASLLLPDSGRCTVNGLDVESHYREIRRMIGYMPGRFSLYMDLTVEENLAFYARVFGTTVKSNYDLIRDVYSQIEPFRKRLAGKLSGGMKQKLALSCALIHRPEVLILDEPTTGVDAVSRREFWEMLKKIREEGITVVVSTPYMDEAALCDRVGLIQKGELLGTFNPLRPPGIRKGILYSMRSRMGAYRYLDRVRQLEACRSAWLFGNELHITLRSERDEGPVRAILQGWEDPSIEWKRAAPSIEDLFMDLIQPEEAPDNFAPGQG